MAMTEPPPHPALSIRIRGQVQGVGFRPFVWRRHLDFAAIEDTHEMLRRIRTAKGFHGPITLEGHNVKLGKGGIREIEFFTQTRQLIAGGRDAEEEATGVLQRARQPGLQDRSMQRCQDLQPHLPNGLNGLAMLDLEQITKVPVEWWFEILDDLLPFAPRAASDAEFEASEQQRERLHAMLKKHGLDLIRTATGHADDGWRWRLFW